jgi:hypothetical protein
MPSASSILMVWLNTVVEMDVVSTVDSLAIASTKAPITSPSFLSPWTTLFEDAITMMLMSSISLPLVQNPILWIFVTLSVLWIKYNSKNVELRLVSSNPTSTHPFEDYPTWLWILCSIGNVIAWWLHYTYWNSPVFRHTIKFCMVLIWHGVPIMWLPYLEHVTPSNRAWTLGFPYDPPRSH